jgi:hypothetical protein
MARHFPNWIKAYCQFTEASEAPTTFHFWTAISTIAGVLGRRVWKDELHFKWTPNFYIILVAPAGTVTKSTTMGIGFKMLEQIPNIHIGPDSMTWHGLAKCFESAVEYIDYTDKSGKTARILQSAITCSVSELGTFLRPDDNGLISFLTDMWDGKERGFSHHTSVSGNIKLENPWLNIIAATTPSWLQNNFPVELISEGIGSRLIFVYAETKRKLMAYPSRNPKAKNYVLLEQMLLDDLKEIAKLVGEYDLTDEAYVWGEDWYAKHHRGAKNPALASGRYGGYFARKQTHMHKLAMVLAAAKRDNLIIEKEDLVEAEAILSDTETSMLKVFESIGVVDEAKHIAELVAFVKAHQWIKAEDLYRLCYNIMSERDFKQAVKIAVTGEILQVVAKNGINGLSPKTRTIN